MEISAVVAIAAVLVLGSVVSRLYGAVTVYEYQRAILYRNGSVAVVWNQGRHRYFKPHSNVQVVDLRKSLLALPGQEVLTKDNVNLKLSLVGFYEIADPVSALHRSQSYTSEFYSVAQLALRDLVGQYTLDDLLEKKSELDAKLLSTASDGALPLGLKVSQLAIKDVMLPSNLKRAYSAVLEAKKEAQRQLEQARGEQAVLRSLANSAGLFEGNPALLQARVFQALSSGNNTIVFGADDALALKGKKP
jgi:regulator of protease activity HflC (stomatin/prohibitin superfamily)